uniref:Uncharacterized protein n=2 Tax=Avena sativa TaxID=4498 RepID=A0ACD5ZB66_AVESA
MEPENSGTGQTSPRGNDWEVVQLTASNYASAPGAARSEPSDEESEGQVYGTRGDDSALLMSGHFSVPKNEAENVLMKSERNERQEERGTQYAVSDIADDDRHEEQPKDDGLDRVPSFHKGKGLSSDGMESDDGNALPRESLATEDPVTFSSSGYSAPVVAEKEMSWSATESRTTEEKTEEDPTLQNVDNTVTDSSKVVATGEESRPDGSGPFVPRDAWWRKQIISLYRTAKESNRFWPIFVAGAAVMGMVYFRRRWLKGKLHLQQVKLQPASSKEVIAGRLPFQHTSHNFQTEQTSWA